MNSQPIYLPNPPKGWAVIRRLDQLSVALDESIKVITLVPRDMNVAQLACKALETMPLPKTWPTSERQVADLSLYTLDRDKISCSSKIDRSTLTRQPALQAAFEESKEIGAVLAELFVARGMHYIKEQLSDWFGFNNTAKLHLDNNPRTPIDLVHSFGGQPTISELDGVCWHGPYGAHNLVKTSVIRHCANRSQPKRPHRQIGHDVVRIVPNPLD